MDQIGKRVHTLIEQNVKINIIFRNCLIRMYGKCEDLEEAIKIFKEIKVNERNIITWNTMILTNGEHGKGREAPMLYEEMQKEGVKPDNQTITCILKACCETGLIDNAIKILFSMEKKLGFKPNEYHYNCLLITCTEKGLLLLGKRIHDHIIENNIPQLLWIL